MNQLFLIIRHWRDKTKSFLIFQNVTQIYLFIKILLETSHRRIFFFAKSFPSCTPINLIVSGTQPEGITSKSNDQWQISRWLSIESKARRTYCLSLSLSSSYSAIRYRDVGDKLSAQPCVAHDAFSPLVVIAKLRNHQRGLCAAIIVNW